MFIGLATGILALSLPYLSKVLIDEVYASGNRPLMHLVIGSVLAISLSISALTALKTYIGQVISLEVQTTVCLLYFNHLQCLPVRFFDAQRVGEMISRFGDVRASVNTLTGLLQSLILNSVYVLIIPPFLFLLNWRLAVIALVAAPITALIAWSTGKSVRALWRLTAEAAAESTAYQIEMLNHVRTLKLLSAEHTVFSGARHRSIKALEAQLRATATSSAIGFVNGIIRTLGAAAFTYYAWTLILTGDLTLGSLVAFSAYLAYLTGPVGQFVGLFGRYQQTAVSIGRMFEYLNVAPEQDSSAAFHRLPPIVEQISGHVRLDRVSFGYDAKREVLKDLCMEFSPRTITAIVGPSGAGKSSIFRLLSRVDAPNGGSISIDGKHLTQFSLPDLRRQVAVVSQEVGLVSGSIWDNLWLGSTETSSANADEVLRVCRLEELIQSYPDSVRASVAEWGSTLSGGQRQRIALARALLRRAPILLLDEATSQIDVELEAQLFNEIFRRRDDTTVVFITHRIESARYADHIYVVEQGSVTSSGTHEELITRPTSYLRMMNVNRGIAREKTTGNEAIRA